jgi:hypothetical protein
MKLLTDAQRRKLLTNGKLSRHCEGGLDHLPVVKLFTPDGACTWLLSEIDPRDLDRAFGLCDLGMGCPELGYVSLAELARVRGRLGLRIERDLYFKPSKRLTAYASEASAAGCIVA